MNAREQYGHIAEVYDLIHSGFDQAGDRIVETVETIRPSSADVSVLDCACGTGRQLAALTRRGYRVIGSDLSAAMIEKCRDNLRLRGLKAELSVCSWRQLTGKFRRRFDLIVCCGNSIVHSMSFDDLVADIAGMRAVLADQGHLVIGLSDWSKIPDSSFTYWLQPNQRHGAETVTPLYVWKKIGPKGYVAGDLVVIRSDDKGNRHKVYRLEYVRYSLDDIARALKKNGLAAAGIIEGKNPYEEQFIIAAPE